MTNTQVPGFDPRLDLVLERVVDVPPELVWLAWTTPKHLMKWFTPAPWQTIECEIDLRPGGLFRTVMRSPEGENFPNIGCYLEIEPNRKLSWTNVLLPGFRPATFAKTSAGDCADLPFTATITLTPEGKGTRYRAVAQHGDEATRQKHADMGFAEGWGAVLDQLVALAPQLR
jgi:uncharacterized protein YndB with AHSA1/START domain